LGVTLVHAGQITGPETGLIATSTSSDLEHHTALIAGIPWQQSHGETALKDCDLLIEMNKLLGGQCGEFGAVGLEALVLQQTPRGVALKLQSLELIKIVNQRFQPRTLPGNGLQPGGIGLHRGISQLAFQGFEGAAGGLEALPQQNRVHRCLGVRGHGDCTPSQGEVPQQKPDAAGRPAKWSGHEAPAKG
jgi:hypothetical protein